MRSSKSTTFYCFSPPVMLATFVIESVLALYTLLRYRLTTFGRLTVAMLLGLAIFQLCEYHVCGGWGVRASEWSRAGYAAITLLPALGLHMAHVIASRKQRAAVWAAYAAMTGFIAYFLIIPGVFKGYACTGNYVIFQIGLVPAVFYAAYYYGLLFAGICLSLRWASQLQRAGDTATAKMRSLQALVIGYLVFLVPTALANSVKPETRRGIPSIMCGFAILFALILAFYIVPRISERRHKIAGKK